LTGPLLIPAIYVAETSFNLYKYDIIIIIIISLTRMKSQINKLRRDGNLEAYDTIIQEQLAEEVVGIWKGFTAPLSVMKPRAQR
jgi:hypothetical protein